MKILLKTVFLMLAIAAVSPLALAQWPAFSSPKVPKTPDGKPNLEGPTPRMPDGKPDFSGMWGLRGGGGGGQRGGQAAGQRGQAGQGQAAPAAAGGRGGQRGAGGPQVPPLPPDGIPIATFGNAGQGMKDDLPFQPWAKELLDKRRADNMKDNPDAHCLPMGFLQFHNHPEPRKMIQTPNLLVIIYEANSGLRQIFMDGRKLPNKDDIEPWYYGYSVGHWEGDDLVVETTGFSDGQWLDVRGSPLTDAAKVTERFRRPNYGSLEITITVDDPKAYTKPWTVKVNQRIMPDTELIEFICEDRDATHYVGAQK
ncbi:MAG TPA: hypothetical protein VGK48_28800 [Terriglobia bacterium]|jgi:hypothetical protein